MEWWRKIVEASGWPLMMLAGFISAMSLLKALVFIFDIGLTPFFWGMVDWYRDLCGPLYDLIHLIPFPFEVPEYVIDLIIVYSLGISISFRLYQFGLKMLHDENKVFVTNTTPVVNIPLSIGSVFIPFNFKIWQIIDRLYSLLEQKANSMDNPNEFFVSENIEHEYYHEEDRDFFYAEQGRRLNLKSKILKLKVGLQQVKLSIVIIPISIFLFFSLNGF